jgi:putative transposase
MGAVTELMDDEWSLVEDLFDPPVHRGVQGTIPRREIVDAILWVARTGCQWRYLPARFPDWQAVWSQWRRWRDKGTGRPRCACWRARSACGTTARPTRRWS